jgi:hypothetical protein
VEDIWNPIKEGINEEAGKIVGKEEKPQVNSWCDKEC